MKLLFVNDYSEKIGGAEIYMHILMREFKKKGNKVELFSSNVTGEEYIESQGKKDSMKVIKRIYDPRVLQEFKRLYDAFKPDLIHIHGFSNELSPSFLLAVKDTPVVMTVHNSMLVNAVSILSERTGKECKTRTCGGCANCIGWKGAMYEFVKRKVHRQLLKRVNLFITPSRYMKELMEEAGFSPVVHIPNGFELFPYAPIKNFNQLLYVGRLSKEKGVEYLIGAMPAVLKSHSTAKLTIVGDGSEKENLQKQVKDLGIGKHVTFVPNVPHEKLEKYYQDSTIVVVPSIYHDNLPTVCIEAMSVGRPLIGTRMGGIPEMIEENKTGLLVDPQNVNHIEEAMNSILANNKKLNTMAQSTSKKVHNFDINGHIKEILIQYSTLIS